MTHPDKSTRGWSGELVVGGGIAGPTCPAAMKRGVAPVSVRAVTLAP